MPRGSNGARGGRGRGGGIAGRPGSSRGYNRDNGPPAAVVHFGEFTHACEEEMVYKAVLADRVPQFNAAVYLENKVQIGRVEEVFGPLNAVYFTVKPVPGVVAKSFRAGDGAFMDPMRLMPLERFLPKAPPSGAGGPKAIVKHVGRGRGGPRGTGRARGDRRPPSRGGFRGGRGGGAYRGGGDLSSAQRHAHGIRQEGYPQRNSGAGVFKPRGRPRPSGNHKRF